MRSNLEMVLPSPCGLRRHVSARNGVREIDAFAHSETRDQTAASLFFFVRVFTNARRVRTLNVQKQPYTYAPTRYEKVKKKGCRSRSCRYDVITDRPSMRDRRPPSAMPFRQVHRLLVNLSRFSGWLNRVFQELKRVLNTQEEVYHNLHI